MHPLTPNRAPQLPIREDGVYRTLTVKPQRVARTGSIEIELSGGRVTLQGAVDRAALRVVIKLLSR